MNNEPQNAYLPPSDKEALQPFDVRQQGGKKGMVMLVAGFVFLVILLLIILKLFSSGTRGRDQTPRILANNEPYKEVPLERGGVQTPNQDKAIYDVLNGTTGEENVRVATSPEAPMEKPQEPVLETVPEQAPPAANIVIKERSAPETQPQASPQTPVTTPQPNPASQATEPPAVRVAGGYVVQVASLRSRAEANTVWDRLNTSMSDLITNSYFSDIKRVDLDAKGIYYRLRVSGLVDRAEADALCARFKSRGQECIVTKR